MSLTVYATAEELGEWLGAEAPDNAAQLLRSASIRVAKACNRSIYDDAPADADVDPLRDATCAQAAAWNALGVNPDAGGLDVKVVTERKLASADIKYDTASSSDICEAVDELCDEARDLLTSAGLLWTPMPIGADCDYLPTWGLDVPLGYGFGWPSCL